MILRAFTLTEMLVVLTIMGALAALTISNTPRLLERAAFEEARDRLRRDLDAGARDARRRGVYGALEVTEAGSGYAITVAGGTLVRRAFAGGIALEGADLVLLDPSGRYAPARFILRGPRDAQALEIEPFLGRARLASVGAHGSPGRQRHRRLHGDALPRRARRRARRSGCGAHANPSGRHCHGGVRRSQINLAKHRPTRAEWNVGLDDGVRASGAVPHAKAHPGQVCSHAHVSRRAEDAKVRNRLGRTAGVVLPALTLVEMLTALVIAGLMAAFIAGNLGHWLSLGRQSQDEAAFWRDVALVETLLSETAAASIDPQTRLSVSPNEVRMRALAPRISTAPIDLTWRITRDGGADRLSLEASNTHQPLTLLSSRTQLRFRAAGSTIILESHLRGAWSPLAVATAPATAPLACAFDLVTRSCR